MDLNIALWIGGMLFSLGIFAIKVGFGLGFSRIRWNVIFLTLFMYLVLFVLIAMLSGKLIGLLEPILKKGPYLHATMAMGMIGWGIYLLKRETTKHTKQTKIKLMTRNSKINSGSSIFNSLLLLIPCPVCLTAITFSTWSALNVIKWHPAVVGLCLGIVFILLALGIYLFLRLVSHNSSFSTKRINLGLSMMGIGIYFIASLFLPAKIEEAKGVYQSFLTKNISIEFNNSISVLGILFVAFLIGYFTKWRLKDESSRRS